MKSIKEKAEEHAPYTREDSWSKTQKCIIAQTSFESGASYVLDVIERALQNPFQCSFDTLKGNLEDAILQLKK